MLKTEIPNAEHEELDLYAPLDLVNAFVDDQQIAVRAVRAATKELAAAVEAAVPRLQNGGRLVYVGAGTSGRLGLLDSVELPPTFMWPKERAIALLAGGPSALYEAVEGAEDDREQGARDIAAANVGPTDVVILVAASGATPYVLGALEGARRAGALTVGIANNPDAPVAREAEIGVTLDTGSEIISGSTRLKAGTAQKVALNTLSSAIMVRLDKVYKNLMVDVKATNAKLIRRTVALTVRATGTDEGTARRTLEECRFHVKVAIVAIARGLDVTRANEELGRAKGSVRVALAGGAAKS